MAPIKGTQFNDNNTINGGDNKFHKSLVGTNGDDSIYGYAGNDILSGLGGNDSLYGGANNDSLYGGPNNDYLYGEAHNDVLDGGAHNDVLDGGAGNDTLYGRSGFDYLLGGPGNDRLIGGRLDDNLLGGTGNDILFGGTDKDILTGYGFGQNEFDTLTGGTEKDTFVLGDIKSNSVYYLGKGYATITDFSLAQTDKIQIKGSIQDGYSLKLNNWGGGNAQDTGIFYKGDLIGVVQDQNITNVNPNQVFITAS
jgi:Ca2+-binding RTX toxin-like protein